jgi:hypothetical protein
MIHQTDIRSSNKVQERSSSNTIRGKRMLLCILLDNRHTVAAMQHHSNVLVVLGLRSETDSRSSNVTRRAMSVLDDPEFWRLSIVYILLLLN